MLIDGLLVPARCLVNRISITVESGIERVDYFHIELDSHDAILAEGAASETFVDDDSRMIFHNAQEFAALYPGLGRITAVYCAPRVEDGEALEAIRREIDMHAGVTAAGCGEAQHEGKCGSRQTRRAQSLLSAASVLGRGG